MMRLLLLFSIALFSTSLWSQGFERGPITRNFELNQAQHLLKSTTHNIDSTFYYTPDTLSLPFFDEFSSCEHEFMIYVKI